MVIGFVFPDLLMHLHAAHCVRKRTLLTYRLKEVNEEYLQSLSSVAGCMRFANSTPAEMELLTQVTLLPIWLVSLQKKQY